MRAAQLLGAVDPQVINKPTCGGVATATPTVEAVSNFELFTSEILQINLNTNPFLNIAAAFGRLEGDCAILVAIRRRVSAALIGRPTAPLEVAGGRLEVAIVIARCAKSSAGHINK